MTTISHCAEGDPRVTEALKSLHGFAPAAVVEGLTPYLDSSTATIRRAAIYTLWMGKFPDLKPAVEPLEKLLKHEEEFTRGMAALALGQNKVASSYDALVKMTASDSSGYARRCGAIALGWLGDKRTVPTLEAALKDSDPRVAMNAKAALGMLHESAGPAGEALDKAQEAAKAWLALVDNGKYASSWDEATSLWKEKAGKEELEKALKKVRDPLGAVKSRTLFTAAFSKNPPDAAEGDYVLIQYLTHFENNQAIEVISLLREKDGSWKVSSYKCDPIDKLGVSLGGADPFNGKPTGEVIGKAQEAAKAWLALVDEGKYGSKWDDLTSDFMKQGGMEALEKSKKAMRAPLGAVKSRTLNTIALVNAVPGNPDGEGVLFQYDARFENKEAFERIMAMRDKDGVWKISAYECKPAEKTGAATGQLNVGGGPVSEAVGKAQESAKDGSDAKVVEGVGWRGFRVGATRDELVKAYGPPEPNPSPGSQWTGWVSSQHIDCWFDQDGRAVEVRFNKGFTLPLTSGVKIDSPEKDVLDAYGNPDRIVEKPQSIMYEYDKRGVLMWIVDGKVFDFTVIKAQGGAAQPATAANAAESSNDALLDEPQRLYRDWTENQFKYFFDASFLKDFGPAGKAEKEEQWIKHLAEDADHDTIPAINGLAALRSTKSSARLAENCSRPEGKG